VNQGPLQFQQSLRRLEKSLRHDWAQEAPPLTDALRAYRKAWELTLSGESQPTTKKEVLRTFRNRNPILVGDFHTLRRARRSLGGLIQQTPRDHPIGLILELWRHPKPLKAQEVLESEEFILMDGRPVRVVYESALRALAKRQGLVAGCWTNGSPQQRDQSAAACWASLHQAHPQYQWLMFFGEWHLAKDHLPTRLRAHGATPGVLHQSPEPCWRFTEDQHADHLLRIGSDHFAWMHTPPLAQWVGGVHSLHEQDSESATEGTSDIIEALTARLAECALVSPVIDPIAVWPEDDWKGFHATLPSFERNALTSAKPASGLIVHPSQPMVWTTTSPALNQLVEAAAHGIWMSSPASGDLSRRGKLMARTFRRLVACMLNGFLRPSTQAATQEQLFPADSQRGWFCERSVLKNLPDLHECALDHASLYLAIEVLGARAGTLLADPDQVDGPFLRTFLHNEPAILDWAGLAARMRAA